ncbi:reverse transcriptase [Phytophthora megakarya]|uniref:Reverse transcriptase n=1 Tax=Phytophthora megakarya TaxID=4795 RepID=A0A225W3A8_9STRA|nr:reverse transcriptase [Phytophthora megakarya]
MAVEASHEVVTLNADAQGRGNVVILESCDNGLDEMARYSECDVFQDDLSMKDVEGKDFGLPSSAMPGTPFARLDAAYARCMRVSAEELDLEPAVYIREGSKFMSQLNDQSVMLPDLDDISPECDIETADNQLNVVLKKHRKIFLGDGNAAPPPVRGVICDLDVGDAKPKLLEATLIEHSESPWASRIVIVLKKNGVDIRMCIDYRVEPRYGEWLLGVRITERAKLISAFTCPFGRFQWVRMPFGLKNAPLVYQQMINNCRWGFVRLSLEEKTLVDHDVLYYLSLDP